ncbi:MAG: hypothetical protein ACJAXT_001921 [Paracoccaceae bacterium]|jgi:hypothetical protein
MDQHYLGFSERLRRINRSARHRVPNTYIIQGDGLVVPQERRKLRLKFPFRGVISLTICAFCLKGFLIWYLGVAEYEARVGLAITETQFQEYISPVVMPDPVSIWIAQQYSKASALGR